jgi:hypothetical protein
MTEAEWQSCSNPAVMLQFLGGKASERKRRLFLVACCRRIEPLLNDERSRRLIAVSEQYADGAADLGDLLAAWEEAEEARRAVFEAGTGRGEVTAAEAASGLGQELRDVAGAGYAALAAGIAARRKAAVCWWENENRVRLGQRRAVIGDVYAKERQAQADILRELFGDLFHPPALDAAWMAWNGGAVRKIARTVYDGRRFADLPVLADALEDAGCTNRDLLDHCRGGGEHLRGCWLLDLLLGKA